MTTSLLVGLLAVSIVALLGFNLRKRNERIEYLKRELENERRIVYNMEVVKFADDQTYVVVKTAPLVRKYYWGDCCKETRDLVDGRGYNKQVPALLVGEDKVVPCHFFGNYITVFGPVSTNEITGSFTFFLILTKEGVTEGGRFVVRLDDGKTVVTPESGNVSRLLDELRTA